MKHAQPSCARCAGWATAEVAASYTVPVITADKSSASALSSPSANSGAMACWPNLTPELLAIHIQIARELGFDLNTLPPTLEAKQVAEVLGISPGTLEQWRSASAIVQRPDNPVLPFQKIGRSLRYPVWHLAQFILQHTYRRSGERLFADDALLEAATTLTTEVAS